MKTNYVKEAVVLVAGLLLGVLLAHVSAPAAAPAAAPLAGGSSINLNAPQFVNGYAVGAVPVDVNWHGGKIGTSTNQFFWKNTTGQTVIVDLAEITTDGTASTSFKLYMGTSTSSSIANDFSAPFASLINGFLIATSSTATTTSASRTIRVTDGQYVLGQIQAANGTVCSILGTCETATSTNRGFNANWRLRIHD